MEFTAREDIEAPIDYVFSQITDFRTFERSIMRRGGDVERVHGGDAAEEGSRWRVKFRMRGKERKVRAVLSRVDPNGGLTIDVTSVSVDGAMTVDLVALSRARTRVNVSATTTAKTIPAKLLFQSLRFTRGRTEQRFKELVKGFAKDVTKRYRA